VIIQFRGYSKIKVNSKDREMLVIVFQIGPLRICVNANVPDEGKTSAPYYAQIETNLKDKDWTEVKPTSGTAASDE
jgi:hypothetical protein